MVKKHPGYQPQRRQKSVRTPEMNRLPIATAGSSEDMPNYETLSELMGCSDGETVSEFPSTLPSLLVLRNLALSVAEDEITNEDDLKLAALISAKTLILGVDRLKEAGFDVLADKNAISSASRATKYEFTRGMTERFEQQSAIGGTFPKGAKGILGESITAANTISNLSLLGMANIGEIFMGSKNLLREASMRTIQSDPEEYLSRDFDLVEQQEGASRYVKGVQKYLLAKAHLARVMSLNPSQARNHLQATLQALSTSKMRAFVDKELETYERDWIEWSEGDASAIVERSAESQEEFGGMLLDYSILPPGTDLRKFTEEICRGLTSAEQPYVDLDRVAVLQNLRDLFGADTTYFVHGKPRGIYSDEAGQEINESYVGLIIQTHDSVGSVTGEDAVVISPIAKKHAGYFFRHDVSDESWRTVLAGPKVAARKAGARPLKFTNVAGINKYEAYLKKAIELLTCPSEQFSADYELRMQKSGEYKMYRRRAIGQLALSSM